MVSVQRWKTEDPEHSARCNMMMNCWGRKRKAHPGSVTSVVEWTWWPWTGGWRIRKLQLIHERSPWWEQGTVGTSRGKEFVNPPNGKLPGRELEWLASCDSEKVCGCRHKLRSIEIEPGLRWRATKQSYTAGLMWLRPSLIINLCFPVVSLWGASRFTQKQMYLYRFLKWSPILLLKTLHGSVNSNWNKGRAQGENRVEFLLHFTILALK